MLIGARKILWAYVFTSIFIRRVTPFGRMMLYAFSAERNMHARNIGLHGGREITDQCGSSPPETFIDSAVIYAASSEHRKATAAAVSRVRPGRPSGMRRAIASK